ncbi:hypothetical protein HQ544_03860 [Candidatus Falkowbacteria bacterium]|nr:hypothetical protein [Candidatus Falkowbacteria bacterium]
MSENKKLKAEKRDEKKKKLASKQVGFSAQRKLMEKTKNYEGDASRFVK